MQKNLILRHEDVMNNILIDSDKKSSFLMGFLVRKLTHIEYKHLKQTPFLKNIPETGLSHERIISLYPTLIYEIRKYDSIFKELEEELSTYLLKSENNWNITDEESSFYFTLGYTLGSSISYHRDIKDKEIVN